MCFVKIYPQASDSQADSQQKIRILAARKSSEDSEIARPRPAAAAARRPSARQIVCPAASIKLRPSGSGRVVSGRGPRSPLRHDWQSSIRPRPGRARRHEPEITACDCAGPKKPPGIANAPSSDSVSILRPGTGTLTSSTLRNGTRRSLFLCIPDAN